jgi:hypothetical protein
VLLVAPAITLPVDEPGAPETGDWDATGVVGMTVGVVVAAALAGREESLVTVRVA